MANTTMKTSPNLFYMVHCRASKHRIQIGGYGIEKVEAKAGYKGIAKRFSDILVKELLKRRFKVKKW